jgi:hypothetical protein
MSKACLAAATKYLKLGWSPLALCPWNHEGTNGAHQKECRTPGKAPLWPWKRYQDAPPKEAEIKIWWNRVPQSNVGIVMGPVSGLLGLDIDGDEGNKLLEAWSAGAAINTLEFTTPGGGRRLLFVHPGLEAPQIKSFKTADKEAIRVMGRGSQTAAPPSIHASGGAYQWVAGHSPDDMKPADCPQWLLDQIDKMNAPAPMPIPPAFSTPSSSADTLSRVKAYLAQCDPAIAGQGGHNQTFKVACKIVKGFGIDIETAFTLLLTDYNPRCQPAGDELTRLARWRDWSARVLSHGPLSFTISPRRSPKQAVGETQR